MTDLREKIAQAAMQHSDEEWQGLIASDDPLDKLTVTNSRAIAANILALPEVRDLLNPVVGLGFSRINRTLTGEQCRDWEVTWGTKAFIPRKGGL